jgi:hypothetical protein
VLINSKFYFVLCCEEIFEDRLMFLMWLSVRSVPICVGMEIRTTSVNAVFIVLSTGTCVNFRNEQGTSSLVSSGHHRNRLFETSQMRLLRRYLRFSFFIKIQLNTLTSLHTFYCLCYTIYYMFRFILNHSQGDKSKGFYTSEQLY